MTSSTRHIAGRQPEVRLGSSWLGSATLDDPLRRDPVVAHPDETLRRVAKRMAATGLTRFPVVERGAEHRLVGIVALRDLLRARAHSVEEEQDRERLLRVRLALPRRRHPSGGGG